MVMVSSGDDGNDGGGEPNFCNPQVAVFINSDQCFFTDYVNVCTTAALDFQPRSWWWLLIMITNHDYDGDDDCDGGHGLPAPTHHLQLDKRAFIWQNVVDHPKIHTDASCHVEIMLISIWALKLQNVIIWIYLCSFQGLQWRRWWFEAQCSSDLDSRFTASASVVKVLMPSRKQPGW